MSAPETTGAETAGARKVLAVPEAAIPAWEALARDLLGLQDPTPCQGPQRALWHGSPAEQQRAADACADCPAMLACAAYALAAGEPAGTWGGMTTPERTARRRADKEMTA